MAEDATFTASWDSPVVVSEPARAIAGRRFLRGLFSTDRIIELAPA